MSWFHQAFGGHYSRLYAHRNAEEAERCIAMLDARLNPPAGPVLDLGCGAGRHLKRIAAGGRRVVGLDLSPELLAEARSLSAADPQAAPLLRADMRRLPFRDGSFAAIYSLFTTFGYFGALEAHAPLLAEIAGALRDQGLWVLDYLNCRRVSAELAAAGRVEKSRLDGPLRIIETRYLADNNQQVQKDVVITALPGRSEAARALGVGPEGLTYTESVALFELKALKDMAAAAGLEPITAYGDYDGAVLDETNSPRWLMVFKRV